jgi:hypothetical protein
VESENTPKGSSTLLKGLFLFIATLVLASVGYAVWIVVLFWDRVGV